MLLLALLENIDKPLTEPRGFDRNIDFSLPPGLRSLSFDQAEASARPEGDGGSPCCRFNEVGSSDRSGGSSLTFIDLLAESEQAGLGRVGQRRKFNFFSGGDRQSVTNLADIMLARESFEDMLSVAGALRDTVNKEQFRKALTQLMTRRDDVGLLTPMSTEFFPTDFTSSAKVSIEKQAAQGVCPFVEINRNEPPYQTYPDSEPESNLWYFREDPQMNSHHNYWHGLFSNKSLERRGEFFFYMHRQMTIRYNMERLTHNMGLVVPLSPDTWDKPLPLGYDAKLKAEIGVDYEPRPDNIRMSDLSGEKCPPGTCPFVAQKVSVMDDWYGEIQTAIRKKRVITDDGATISLRVSRGRDEGISPLGDIVEAVGSVNNKTYGDIHNQGHIFIAFVTDPAGTDTTKIGVMGNPATNVRDPIFFRWHQFADNIFSDYKASLPPYSDDELGFKEVEILSSSVQSNGGKNVLRTFLDKEEWTLHGSTVGTTNNFLARYNILNHEAYEYKIEVQSNLAKVVRAKLRIFLIPKSSPVTHANSPFAIEMDRFLFSLEKGKNTITRKSTESTVVAKRQRTLLELQEDFAHNNITEPELELFDGCGWPAHLLVPKGTASGNQFDLVVVLSRLLPGDAALSVHPEKISKSSFVHCGLPGGTLMPDSRPMGFPFDRPVTWRMPANMARTPVTIFHVEL